MKLLRTIAVTGALACVAFGQASKRSPAKRLPGPAPTMIERFNQMSPAQKEQFFERLPPERRKLMEERIERFNRRSPEDKAWLREQYERFQELPEEQQDEARRVFRRFNNLPEDRQKILREEMDALRKLSPEERRERVHSPDFVEKFSTQERRLMRDMGRALESRASDEEEENN